MWIPSHLVYRWPLIFTKTIFFKWFSSKISEIQFMLSEPKDCSKFQKNKQESSLIEALGLNSTIKNYISTWYSLVNFNWSPSLVSTKINKFISIKLFNNKYFTQLQLHNVFITSVISVLSSMVATSHVWLLSTWNVAYVTEEPNF